MTPLEQTMQGLILAYQTGPRTVEHRKKLMDTVRVVLDYFVEINENEAPRNS